MIDLNQIVRDNIKQLVPYSSARDEFTETSEDMVFLDANENPFKTEVNRYPDPQQVQVKQRLAELKNVSVKNILLGNGSDEVIDLIFRAFCEPNKDNVIILPPTYGMYKVCADINAVNVKSVSLTQDFQPDVNLILESVDANTKLLFLCSPNNPSGNSFKPELIIKLLSQFNGIVVIDEAYIDFSSHQSWLNKLNEYPNLVVTQTFSKAYGMAGIRLGICYASEQIITILNTIKPPYNINLLTQLKALECLKHYDVVQKQIEQIKENKVSLINQLGSINFLNKIYTSDANFLLVKVDNANKRYAQLIENGIVVRNRTKQALCDNCLRFTVGTKIENEKLVNALKSLS